MITTIDFRNTPCFDEKAELTDLRQVNFIFGPNGAGKTTITRAAEAQLTAGGHTVHVYNHDYVSNVFHTSETGSDGEIQGITFTLGEKDASKQEQLKLQRKRLADTRKKLEGTDGSSGQKGQLAGLKQERTNYLKILKKSLKDIWKPHQASQHLLEGMKQDVTKLVDKLLQYKDSVEEHDTLGTISFQYEQLKSGSLKEISIPFPGQAPCQLNAQHVTTLLTTPIDLSSASPLYDFAMKHNLLPWIREGYDISQRDTELSETCPYCQQSLDDELKKHIASLFSEETNSAISTIRNTKQSIEDFEYKIEALVTDVKQTAIYEEEAIRNTVSYIDACVSSIRKTCISLEHKLNAPQRVIHDGNKYEHFDAIDALIQSLRLRIEDYNRSAKNQRQALKDAETRFFNRLYHDSTIRIKEAGLSDKGLDDYYRKKILGLGAGIRNMEKQIADKEKEIENIKKEITALQESLSDTTEVRRLINFTLDDLGFVRFRLGASSKNPKLFVIERPSNANSSRYDQATFASLSEGEKTILSFLYFMHCIKPDSIEFSERTKLTVIIDDPIASTDASTFYFITALIRRIVRRLLHPNDSSLNDVMSEKVVQAIILTHNVGFYTNASYEVRRDYNHEEKGRKVAFYRINKSFEQGKPNSIETVSNPDVISTEYQLLWNEVFAAEQACEESDRNAILPQYRLLANTMRRILDSYFITLGNTNIATRKKSDKSSITRLGQTYGEKVEQCMIQFNLGSHGSYANFSSCTTPTRKLLEDFKDIFKHQIDGGAHYGHYLMMMGREQ